MQVAPGLLITTIPVSSVRRFRIANALPRVGPHQIAGSTSASAGFVGKACHATDARHVASGMRWQQVLQLANPQAAARTPLAPEDSMGLQERDTKRKHEQVRFLCDGQADDC